jgi:GT2 family glycosyltransferase
MSAPPHVVAVIATDGRSEYLPRALVALASQTVRPGAVVVADAGPQSDPAIAEMAIRCGIPREILTVVHAVRAKNFGQAVAAGLSGRDAGAQLWLLHDDSYPAPDCLANLMACVEVAPSVAVAGPKQVRADDPTRLGEVGVTTTPFGRRVPNGRDGELDQGQYDALEDVLAVGSAGMLVKSDVWQSLGGFASGLGPFRDGLEFCRRARLAGYRVVVEPTAVLEHEQASYKGLREAERRRRAAPEADAERPEPSTDRSYGARRRALIFTELVDAPLWALIPIAVAAAVAGIGRFFWRIAAKDFRLAVDEVLAPVAVLTRFDSVARARYVAGRTRRMPRRRLASLQVSTSEARQARRDRRMTEAELRRRTLAPTEIEMAELRELASRRRRMITAVVLVAVAITGAAMYRLVGPGFITGGALGSQDAAVTELARLAAGGWLTQGLGEPGPGDPFNAVLAVLTLLCFGHGATAVKLALLAAPLIAALGAWFAAGAAARSVWIRAWVAIFYLAAPSLWAAVAQGRLGAVVAHAALPWALLGAARAIGVNCLDVRPAVADAAGTVRASVLVARPGSLAAAAFAGLAFAVAAAGSPALLAPGLMAVVGAFVLAGKGRRARLVWVALPVLALFLPLIWDAVASDQWRALLADPGPVLAYQPAPFWLQLLGWPAEPSLPGLVPAGLVQPVAALLTGALAVAAVGALFRTGRRARAVRFGWFLAVLGAATIFVLDRLGVTVDGLEPVRAWTGGACALVLIGLALAAASGLSGAVGEVGARHRRLRAGLATACVAALVAGPLAGGVVDVWQRLGHSDVRRAATDPMPPIVAAEATGPRATYALVVGAGQDAALRWDLVRGAGHQLSEAAGVAGSRQLGGWPGRVAVPDAADQAVSQVVAAISARNPGDAAATLASFGIGFVLVGAEDQSLAAALDATAGMTRVREDADGAVVWRVGRSERDSGGPSVDAAARLHVVDTDGSAAALDAGPGTNLRASLPDGPDGRRLVLAERADGKWRASLDGEPLAAVESGGWYQAFEVPAGSGRLHVWHAAPWGFALAQVVVLLLAALLALPIRRAAAVREDS